jgi:hypothetical protein
VHRVLIGAAFFDFHDDDKLLHAVIRNGYGVTTRCGASKRPWDV